MILIWGNVAIGKYVICYQKLRSCNLFPYCKFWALFVIKCTWFHILGSNSIFLHFECTAKASMSPFLFCLWQICSVLETLVMCLENDMVSETSLYFSIDIMNFITNTFVPISWINWIIITRVELQQNSWIQFFFSLDRKIGVRETERYRTPKHENTLPVVAEFECGAHTWQSSTLSRVLFPQHHPVFYSRYLRIRTISQYKL